MKNSIGTTKNCSWHQIGIEFALYIYVRSRKELDDEQAMVEGVRGISDLSAQFPGQQS